MKTFLAGLCIVGLGTLGLWLGVSIHGWSVQAAVAPTAGTLGGIGIVLAGRHVLRLAHGETTH